MNYLFDCSIYIQISISIWSQLNRKCHEIFRFLSLGNIFWHSRMLSLLILDLLTIYTIMQFLIKETNPQQPNYLPPSINLIAAHSLLGNMQFIVKLYKIIYLFIKYYYYRILLSIQSSAIRDYPINELFHHKLSLICRSYIYVIRYVDIMFSHRIDKITKWTFKNYCLL